MFSFLFSPTGRIGRAQYWLFVLVYIVVLTLAALIEGSDARNPGWLTVGLAVFFVWPSIALTIKRWHDRDKSGWWILVGMIPVVGPIWLFIENGLLPGTDGRNRFGAPA